MIFTLYDLSDISPVLPLPPPKGDKNSGYIFKFPNLQISKSKKMNYLSHELEHVKNELAEMGQLVLGQLEKGAAPGGARRPACPGRLSC